MSDQSLQPGDRVRLISTGEVGVVVWTWRDDELDGPDTYVAFFGESFPMGRPDQPPYILRYFATSLQRL